MSKDIDKKTLNAELTSDELASVSGGRELNSKEIKGYNEMEVWIQGICSDLRRCNRFDDEAQLSNALHTAFNDWKARISALPEGSPSEDFESYFNLMYGGLLHRILIRS